MVVQSGVKSRRKAMVRRPIWSPWFFRISVQSRRCPVSQAGTRVIRTLVFCGSVFNTLPRPHWPRGLADGRGHSVFRGLMAPASCQSSKRYGMS